MTILMELRNGKLTLTYRITGPWICITDVSGAFHGFMLNHLLYIQVKYIFFVCWGLQTYEQQW